jgi:Na+-driven multidrug efflux pump
LVSAIMRVGGLSAIGTIQANLTVALVTGAVGIYGAPVTAGYGIASRLDYLLIPLLFGFGTAAVTMVGANVGAGNAARARRIAWIGAAIGGGATGAPLLKAAVAARPLTALADRTWRLLVGEDLPPAERASPARLYASIVLRTATIGPPYLIFAAISNRSRWSRIFKFAKPRSSRQLADTKTGT